MTATGGDALPRSAAEGSRPRLVALSDELGHPGSARLLGALAHQAAPGTLVLVLRDRELAIGEREALGRALAAAAQASEQRFVVAVARDAPRPFALAAALGASGVHLPAGGPLPSAARAAGFSWVSRAHHDLEELAPLERAALSALFVSPAFAPRKGRLALGEQGLRARLELLARLAPGVQLLALGGVDAASAPLALRAGAQGVAVIGAAHDSAAQRLLLLRLGLER